MSDKELFSFLKNNFGLTHLGSELSSEDAYLKHIQEMLAVRIEFYINSNLDKLLQILYKIDVPQNETDAAFELGEIKKISLRLAERIIVRQLQKIEYSKEFYKKESK